MTGFYSVPEPIFITDSYEDVHRALTDAAVEGIIWKGAVPAPVLNCVTAFDFDLLSPGIAKNIQQGRDLFKKETVAMTSLRTVFPQLEILDLHVRHIKSLFQDMADDGPQPSRKGHAECHFVSRDETIIPAQVPHIDLPKSKQWLAGWLKGQWTNMTPAHYPSFKLVAALNLDSGPSTSIIPSAFKGQEDAQARYHYPDADMSRAQTAEPGDITVLKMGVTVHCAPKNTGRRWVLNY